MRKIIKLRYFQNKTKIILIAFFSVILSGTLVYACGPYFPVFYHTPQLLSKLTFQEQSLNFSNMDSVNIIIPDDVDVYALFPIYRKLINKPLSEEDKKYLYYVAPDPLYTTSDTEPYYTIYPPTPYELWIKEKNSVDVTNYKTASDCSDSTYITATLALEKRKNTYSKSDTLEWIKNQDKVFSLCSKSIQAPDVITRESKMSWFVSFFKRTTASIVNKVTLLFSNKKEDIAVISQNNATTTEKCNTHACLFDVKYKGMLQEDYEYQQASMSFYESDFNLASKQFESISKTENHPWQMYATYSLGRTYLALGEELKMKEDYNKKAIQQFQILIDRKSYKGISSKILKDLQSHARLTVERILFRNDYNILETTNNSEVMKIVLDEISGAGLPKETKDGSSYTEWVYAMTGTSTESLSKVKNNYKQTKQEVWLVPIIKRISKSDPMFPEISSAIKNLPKTFPAYWTVHYYLIKAYIDGGNKETAKILLSQLPKTPSPVVWNYIEDLHMLTSDTLQDIFKHSVRYSITTDYLAEDRDSNKVKNIVFMDDKAKDLFSFIPLEKQMELFSSNTLLSKNQTELVRLTIFSRAILQDNFFVADTVAKLISENNQEIGSDLYDYLHAKNKEDKKFTSVLFLLKYPGVGLWLYDDIVVKVPYKTLTTAMMWEDNLVNSYKSVSNYSYHRWDYCQPYDFSYNEKTREYDTTMKDYKVSGYDISFIDKIISNKDKILAVQELKKSYKIPPNYFAEVVLGYAKKYPKDVRIPEALATTVKMTKYSTCSNGLTSSYSKDMFDLLHKKYPDSIWTKNTKFHY